MSESAYYRDDLAMIHDRGFGFHADRCAPGILTLLRPVRERDGLVLELGCGSGHLTRHLVKAGHRVVATDASESMLALARAAVPGAERHEQLVLPDDPMPEADAIVSVGHVLNYLPEEAAIHTALQAAATALRPGGVLAVDLQDLAWGDAFTDARNSSRIADDWTLISEFDVPDPKLFVRRHVTFVLNADGSWRRDEEIHRNVLLDTAELPSLFAEDQLEVRIAPAFGEEKLPAGLIALIGQKNNRPAPDGTPVATIRSRTRRAH